MRRPRWVQGNSGQGGKAMKRSRFVALAAVLVTAAVASIAATAAPATAGTAAPTASRATSVVHVGFAVQKFVLRGKTLVAVGKTIATVTTDEGTYTTVKPFASTVTKKAAARAAGTRGIQQATRICDVLTLTLGPLHLELLGLIVDLNRVVLTLKANSEGGLLGGLLCGLAGGGGILGTATNATQLTKAANSSGLSLGPGFNVPVQTVAAASGSTGQQALQAVCTVLDLTLGPIDLNLLGLMVHLDQVHLLITANPAGGLLGSLLCSLAGGLPTTPTTPVTPPG